MLDALFYGSLMVLAVWFALYCIGPFNGHRLERRQQEREQAMIDRPGRWICPECRQPFGPRVEYVGYGHCKDLVIVCPHCRFLNRFSTDGMPQFDQGTYFDPVENQRREQQWRALAPTLHCPGCGIPFEDWDGITWGADAPESDRSRGDWVQQPAYACRRCGTEALVSVGPDGTPRVVREFDPGSLPSELG